MDVNHFTIDLVSEVFKTKNPYEIKRKAESINVNLPIIEILTFKKHESEMERLFNNE